MDRTANGTVLSTDDTRVVEGTPAGGAGGAEEPVPDRLGRYEIRGRLGRGGMGEVLRGFDPQLDREVALKRVRGTVLKQTGQERLLREARGMAALNHPNVVGVFDVEELGGEVVIAMELVEGPTLRSWLARGPDRRAILDAFVQAARGLQAVHEAGLVHRDFKPTNVLVAPDGRLKVTDFGLVRGSSGDSDLQESGASVDRDSCGGSQSLTRAGFVLGTPVYMAPEQQRGDASGASSDQFAFCVALWEALSGELPFRGKNERDLIEAKESREVHGERGIPKRIREVLLRGLEPERSRRWPDMAALVDALQAASRRGGVLPLLGAGVLVVAAVAIGTGSLRRGAPRPVQLAPTATGARVGSAALVLRGKKLRLAGDFDAAARDLEAAYAESAEVDSPVALQAAEIMIGLALDTGDMAAATRWVSVADAAAERLDEPDAEVQVVNHAARLAEGRGDLVAAERGYREAIEMRRALGNGDDAGTGRLVYRLGVILGQRGRHREAQTTQREALGILGARFGEDSVDVAASVDALGIDAYYLGEYAEAREHHERARRIYEAAYGPKNILVADTAINAGIAKVALGDLAGARTDYELGLEVYGEKAPDSAKVAGILGNLGNLAQKERRFDDARRYFEQALVIFEEVHGPTHRHTLLTVYNIAVALLNTERFDEAAAYFERALAGHRATLGDKHPQVGHALLYLAQAHAELGQRDRARTELREALPILEDTAGEPEYREDARDLAKRLGLD